MSIKFLLFFIVSLFAFNSFSCLNGDSKLLSNGSIIYSDREIEVPEGHFIPKNINLLEVKKDLENHYDSTKNIDYLSDQGVILILLGKYDQAIELYEKIESIAPNRYSTASNIGTAYELTGNYKTALIWIQKSVDIDSSSHHGSEWIHVNILKAFLENHNSYSSQILINTDFGNEPLPQSKLNKSEIKKLSYALFYQINERMTFIKERDPMVAQLLFDLGNLKMLLNQYPDAIKIFNSAKKYGYSNKLIDDRLNMASSMANNPNKKLVKSKKTNLIDFIYEITIGTVLLAVIVFIIIFRKRKSD